MPRVDFKSFKESEPIHKYKIKTIFVVLHSIGFSSILQLLVLSILDMKWFKLYVGRIYFIIKAEYNYIADTEEVTENKSDCYVENYDGTPIKVSDIKRMCSIINDNGELMQVFESQISTPAHVFHGACLRCVMQQLKGIDYCAGCMYRNAKWALPDLRFLIDET